MPDQELKIFEKIIASLSEHKGSYYALNQIAYFALGKGDPANTARVGRVINTYKRYFLSTGYGKATKWHPNWDRIYQDFPSLLKPSKKVSSTSRESIYKDILQALQDEKKAVNEELIKNPINILACRRAPELEQVGDIIYVVIYKTDMKDEYFPIPDGAPIRIWIHGHYSVNGTLLAHDGLLSQAIVLLEGPLPDRFSGGVLQPRIEELIAAIANSVQRSMEDTNGLHNKILASTMESSVVAQFGVETVHLDKSQAAAAKLCCNQDLSLLWGPPGTGKTYTLGEIITNWIKNRYRVLAVSIANVAVDQIGLKTRDALERHNMISFLNTGKILRYGYARDSEMLKDKRFYPDKERAQAIRRELYTLTESLKKRRDISQSEKAVIMRNIDKLKKELRTITQRYVNDAKVVLTTIVQTCIDPSLFSEVPFDVVVIDEASMISIPHLISVMSLAKNHVLIAGDFRQLGPIALSNSEKSHQWLHRDVFSLFKLDSLHDEALKNMMMLKTQRRMHPHISRTINEAFYKNLLIDGAPEKNLIPSRHKPLPGIGAVLIKVSPEDGCEIETTPAGSRKNNGTALITSRLSYYYATEDPNVTIGVITPYRAQVRLIQNHLKFLCSDPSVLNRITVGTIHTFQGSERDIIIWDIVEMRNFKIGRLYRGESGDRLVNVAITRAKGKLLAVGDPKAFFIAPGCDATGKVGFILKYGFEDNEVNWKDFRKCINV